MRKAGLGADPGLGCGSSMVTSAQAAAPKKPLLAHETWVSELLLSPPEFLSPPAQLRTALYGLQPWRLIFFHCIFKTVTLYFCQESCFAVSKSLRSSSKYLLNIQNPKVSVQSMWYRKAISRQGFLQNTDMFHSTVYSFSFWSKNLRLGAYRTSEKMPVMLYIYFSKVMLENNSFKGISSKSKLIMQVATLRNVSYCC